MHKRAQAYLRILFTKCVYQSYKYSLSMYKQDLAINNQQWLICNKTQPNQISKYLSNNG